MSKIINARRVRRGKGTCVIAFLVLGALVSVHATCSEHDPLSKDEAIALMAEGQQLETQNRPQAAYYKYKSVETSYEVNDKLRSTAWDAAQRVRLLIDKQYKEIETELRRYFEEHGVYPDSLTSISDRLTDIARSDLGGFRYERVSDTEFKLEDGIIG